MRANEVIIVDPLGNHLEINSYQGEQSIPVVAGFRDISISYLQKDNVTSSDQYILADLDGTGAFPHSETGEIDLEWCSIFINPGSAFEGTFKLANISAIDGVGAHVKTIFSWQLERSAAIISDNLYFPIGGALRGTMENWIGPSTSNATFITTNSYEGPDGNYYNPGSGDLVLDVTVNAGAVDFSYALGYQSRAVI